MSNRTPQEIYDYETKRSEEYLKKLNDLIDGHKNEDMIRHLFEWYGKARAIKSKAYQDMKVLGYILVNPETNEIVKYTLSEEIAIYGTKEEALGDGFPESWILKILE